MNVAKVKAAVRLRDGMRCVVCELTNEQHVERFGRQLHVHRVAPGSPYTLDGCVTVCQSCHGRQHIGELSSKGLTGRVPRQNRKGVSIHVWVDPATADALNQFIASHRLPPSVTDTVELALLEFLKKEGFPAKPAPKTRP